MSSDKLPALIGQIEVQQQYISLLITKLVDTDKQKTPYLNYSDSLNNQIVLKLFYNTCNTNAASVILFHVS